MHHGRWVKHKDLNWGFNMRAGNEVIGYNGAHRRVDQAKGFARDHACVWCGRAAAHWAYRHDDPNELVHASNDNDRGMVYSLRIDSYQPMCGECHHQFDKGLDEGLRTMAQS